ncbi:MAG: metal ABC transporter permease [Minisyncoccia bacterium]
MNFLDIFQYGFIVRGLEAGIIVAAIAPLIGIFLVLRRYSLIADTLAHVSLAGIALGLLLNINPIFTALGTTVAASLGIDRLRTSKRIYGESALALFLSGSLALATVLLSYGNGLNTNLFKYLFGSIVTVTQNDVYTIAALGVVVIALLTAFYKELVYISFDEEAARVSGIPVQTINTILIVLAALTISLAIPVVGVLLIAALIVIPVITTLQLRQSFAKTILYAEVVSLFSVLSGIFLSFYLDLSTGGTIVLIMLAIFLTVTAMTRR